MYSLIHGADTFYPLWVCGFVVSMDTTSFASIVRRPFVQVNCTSAGLIHSKHHSGGCQRISHDITSPQPRLSSESGRDTRACAKIDNPFIKGVNGGKRITCVSCCGARRSLFSIAYPPTCIHPPLRCCALSYECFKHHQNDLVSNLGFVIFSSIITFFIQAYRTQSSIHTLPHSISHRSVQFYIELSFSSQCMLNPSPE